jgi:hypothetical protein
MGLGEATCVYAVFMPISFRIKRLTVINRRKGGFPSKTVSPAEFLDKVLPEIPEGKRRRWMGAPFFAETEH